MALGADLEVVLELVFGIEDNFLSNRSTERLQRGA